MAIERAIVHVAATLELASFVDDRDTATERCRPGPRRRWRARLRHPGHVDLDLRSHAAARGGEERAGRAAVEEQAKIAVEVARREGDDARRRGRIRGLRRHRGPDRRVRTEISRGDGDAADAVLADR